MILRYAVIFSTFVFCGGCSAQEEARFTKACEDLFSNQLTAPSTYKRVSSHFDVQTSFVQNDELQFLEKKVEQARQQDNADDLQAAELEQIYARMMQDDGRGRRKLSALVTFDAQNASGTPVRSQFNCTFDDKRGQEFQNNLLHKMNIRIDGLTANERAKMATGR